MATFAELDATLQGRNKTSRKVNHHTYAERNQDGSIGIRFHKTQVVVFFPDGRVTLHTGGWRTVTTKARINEFAPDGISVGQVKRVWYVFCRALDTKSVFTEGFELLRF